MKARPRMSNHKLCGMTWYWNIFILSAAPPYSKCCCHSEFFSIKFKVSLIISSLACRLLVMVNKPIPLKANTRAAGRCPNLNAIREGLILVYLLPLESMCHFYGEHSPASLGPPYLCKDGPCHYQTPSILCRYMIRHGLARIRES